MNRLAFVTALPIVALLTACGTPRPVAVMTAQSQSAMTPQAVLADLKAGNERFVAGRSSLRDYRGEVGATADGQYPKAVVLSCLDSRVVPELIFDQGIGDLFVGRNAGNFDSPGMLGSFEFATAAAGSKLIVVLGHSSCGAIKGAADGVELGNLTDMLRNFDGALGDARGQVSGPYDSKNKAYVDAGVKANVLRTMADIRANSSVIAGLVDSGAVDVVGGVYDLATGRVTWLQ